MRRSFILLLLGILLAEALSPVVPVLAGTSKNNVIDEQGLVAPGFTGVLVGGPIWFSAPSLSGKILLATSSWGLRAYSTGSLKELWWVFRGIPVYGAALDDEKGLLIVLTSTGLEAYNTRNWGLLWANPGINPRSLSVGPLEAVGYMALSGRGLVALVLRNWSLDRGYSYKVYVVDAGSGTILYNQSMRQVEGLGWSPTRPILAYTDGQNLVLVDFSSRGEPRTKTVGLDIAKDVSWNKNGTMLCVARGPYGVSLFSLNGTRLATIYAGLSAEKTICATGGVIAASENYVEKIGLNGTIEWLSPPITGTVVRIHALSDGRTAVLAKTYTGEKTVFYLLGPNGQLEKIHPLYAKGLETTAITSKGLIVVTRTRILSLEPGALSASSVKSYRHGLPLVQDTILVNATTILAVIEKPLGVSKGYEIAYYSVGGKATSRIMVVGKRAPQVLYAAPSFTSLFLGEGYITVYSSNGTLEWARYIGSPLFYKAVWSNNGELLAVLEPYRGELRLFNRSGALLASKTYNFRSTVYRLVFSPNAQYLALIGFRDIYILETNTLKKIMTIGNVRAKWSWPPIWDWKNRLWVRTEDTLLLVDPAANTTRTIKAPGLAHVEDIAPSPRGDLVAAIGYKNSRAGAEAAIIVFRPTGERVWEKTISEDTYLKSISWSNRGDHIILLTSYESCLGTTAYTAVYSAKTGAKTARILGEYCKAAYFDKEQILALRCDDAWRLYSLREKRFLNTGFPANQVTGASYTSRGAYISIATPSSKEKYQWIYIDLKNGAIKPRPAKTWFNVATPSGNHLIKVSYYCRRVVNGYETPAAKLEAYSFRGEKQWSLRLDDTVDLDMASFLPNRDIMILITGNSKASYHVNCDNGTLLGRGEFSDTYIKATSIAEDRIAYGYQDKIVVVDPGLRKVFEEDLGGGVIDVSLDRNGELLAVIQKEQQERKLLVYSIASHTILLVSPLPGGADYAIWTRDGDQLAVVDRDHHLLVLESTDWRTKEYPLPTYPRALLVSTLVHQTLYTGHWNNNNSYLAIPSLEGVNIVPVTESGRPFLLTTPYEPMDVAWVGSDTFVAVGDLGVDVYNLTRLLNVKEREVYKGIYYQYKDNIYIGENSTIIVGSDGIAIVRLRDNASFILKNVFPKVTVSPQLQRLYIYLRDVVYWAPIRDSNTALHPLYYAGTGVSIHGLYAISIPGGKTFLLLLLYKGIVAVDKTGKTLWTNWGNDLRGFKEVEWSPSAKLVMVKKPGYSSTEIILLDAISGKEIYATSLKGYLMKTAWLGETLYLEVYLETSTGGELRVYHIDPHAKVIERIPGAISAAGSPSGDMVAILYQNETILLMRATGEKTAYTGTGFRLLCCISSNGRTVYGYTSNILTGLSTATGEKIVYGDHNPLAILSLRDKEIAISNSYSGLYTAKPALWSLLYILPPQTPLTLTIANRTINLEKGLRLYIEPGNVTLTYRPKKPLTGLEALGSPEWYTRLTITINKTLKAFTAAIEKPPTAKDFEKRLGRITLDATKTKSTIYSCNITWAENGIQQANLSSGDRKSYPALPGTYRVKCAYSHSQATGNVEVYKETVIVEQGREAVLILPQASPSITTTTSTTTTTSPQSQTLTTQTPPQTTTTTHTTSTTTTSTITVRTRTTTITTTTVSTPINTTTQSFITTTTSTTKTATTARSLTTSTITPTITTTQKHSATMPVKTREQTPTYISAAIVIIAVVILATYTRKKKNK